MKIQAAIEKINVKKCHIQRKNKDKSDNFASSYKLWKERGERERESARERNDLLEQKL